MPPAESVILQTNVSYNVASRTTFITLISDIIALSFVRNKYFHDQHSMKVEQIGKRILPQLIL